MFILIGILENKEFAGKKHVHWSKKKLLWIYTLSIDPPKKQIIGKIFDWNELLNVKKACQIEECEK